MCKLAKFRNFDFVIKNIFILKSIVILFILTTNSIAQPDSIWTQMYGGTGRDYCYEAFQTRDGGFALVGSYAYEIEHGHHHSMYCLIKTDSIGRQEWLEYYNLTQVSHFGISLN